MSMSNLHRFSIKRALDLPGREAINESLQFPEALNIKRRQPDTMGVSLLESRTIQDAYRDSATISIKARHDRLLGSIANSACEPLNVSVTEVSLFRGGRDSQTLALKVSDSENELWNEYSHFVNLLPITDRKKEHLLYGFHPHITLARIPTALATTALLDDILGRSPRTLTLKPTTTTTPQYVPRSVRIRYPEWAEQFAPKTDYDTEYCPTIQKIEMPPKHPHSFLQSLQK